MVGNFGKVDIWVETNFKEAEIWVKKDIKEKLSRYKSQIKVIERKKQTKKARKS